MLFVFIVGGIGFAGRQAMVHPETPLPPEWNLTRPLSVTDPLTSFTKWKLRRALGDDRACLMALATGARALSKPDLLGSADCGISPQVTLDAVAGASLKPVNTRCQTALRLAMWTQHGLQPTAQEIFGQRLARVEHLSSYSCRAIRTTSGETERMSTHSTADAIDISGFVLVDGTTVNLLRDWGEGESKARFLRQANATACDWFRVTLGPEYNMLHADHFHLQHTGYGLCR
ncbi:MAG: extensin family protein [Sulfitobacter sp.]